MAPNILEKGKPKGIKNIQKKPNQSCRRSRTLQQKIKKATKTEKINQKVANTLTNAIENKKLKKKVQ